MKSALVTGITGQDGSYLAELLLDKGYEVHGMKRRSSSINTERIDHLFGHPRLHLHYGDLTDTSNMMSLIRDIHPDEIYNLGAQSHVQVSFETPEHTANADAVGTLRILEAIRQIDSYRMRFYQAGTSEMFGASPPPQSEQTPFYPRSPYGVAKLYGYWITRNYREAYDLYACSGILFNHESPRRGETFVTRKIVRGLADISRGVNKPLELGNLYALRDWGHAKDFVRAMWMMLQQDEPRDYVIATGEQYSVKDFVNACAPYFGMSLEWSGEGISETAVDSITGTTVVVVNPKYFRPSEVESLCGDSTLARDILGWQPEISFYQLIEEMCENEIRQ